MTGQKIYTELTQSRQVRTVADSGEGPGGPSPPYFSTKLGPRRDKNIWGETAPSPLSLGLDDRAPLISRSGSGTGADLGFFLGGGALVSCSTSTPINHIVFFLQNTSCIRNPQVISGGGGVRTPCTLPLDPPLLSVLSSLKSLPIWDWNSSLHLFIHIFC